MRPRLATLLLASLALVHRAAAEEASPLGLSTVETSEVRVVHLTPALDFLEPHVLRTFANSLAWQRRVFGWQPYERTTVFLKDFSDYGNASASSVPRNALTFEVSPPAHAFETLPASESMYSAMNHELVHVATMDMSTAQDRFWRTLFAGKIYPDARHPESV